MEQLKKFTFFSVLIVAISLSMGGCELECDADEGPVEEVAEEIEDAVD
jgi:hypothetical protein